MRLNRVLIAMAALVCGMPAAHAQSGSDWPTFGGAAGGAQYSPLKQINIDNVDELEVAWVHHSGDAAWL